MWCLVPGEDSNTGNVTGGRKLARYVLVFREMQMAIGRELRRIASGYKKGSSRPDAGAFKSRVEYCLLLSCDTNSRRGRSFLVRRVAAHSDTRRA